MPHARAEAAGREEEKMGKMTLTINDNTLKENGEPEKTTVSIPAIDVTDLGTLTTFNAACAAFITAVDGVTLGVMGKDQRLIKDTVLSNAAATSSFAQRENKWLVTVRGATTGKLYQFSVGTADLNLLTPNGEDMAVSAAQIAFIAAIEDLYRGNGFETVSVVSIKFVGRNT